MASDDEAVRAIGIVLAKSGGATTWGVIKSSRETFQVKDVSGSSDETTRHFLDDWSTEATRYRRMRAHSGSSPEDHNGSTTFITNVRGHKLTVPEFDQARAVADRLPAAAAEIMLRNHSYVLKMARSRPCDSGSICVDVFEKYRPGIASAPEQQWTISTATGLPTTIAISGVLFGPTQMNPWRVVHYLQYEAHEGLTLPVSLEVDGPTNNRTAWTFISFTPNPGFDTVDFDREASR